MHVCFLTEVDLRFLYKFDEKTQSGSFIDKEKEAWLLIISSVKAFDSLLSTFSRYYHA